MHERSSEWKLLNSRVNPLGTWPAELAEAAGAPSLLREPSRLRDMLGEGIQGHASTHSFPTQICLLDKGCDLFVCQEI